MTDRSKMFLRSINIQYDALDAGRIAHFQPTSKTIPLLRSLTGFDNERAFFIIAPYGSGKSLAATYLLHVLENREDSKWALQQIEKRLKSVSTEFTKFASKRRKNGSSAGVVIPLHGYCPSLSEALQSGAVDSMKRLRMGRQSRPIATSPCGNIDQAIDMLNLIRGKALENGIDHVTILWDEFGRHIEQLIAEGKTSSLIEIQQIAEYVNRSSDVCMSFGLFLHQDLLNYAWNIPQSLRTEWTKIEGRFKIIQYIEDSKELYRLVGELVASRAPSDTSGNMDFNRVARKCHRHGIFKNIPVAELGDLLGRAYPLEPVSLYLLPKMAARLAQNERTLFSYLYSVNLESPAGPETLYDFFEPVMQSDTVIGGSYRRWLETNSAISKTKGDALEERALKTTCLLGLGGKGERAQVKRTLLDFALQGYSKNKTTNNVIDALLETKLLLHRKHVDEVSVWHGTDVDIRRKLDEEKRHHKATFDVMSFLNKEMPPPTWKPLQYNDEYFVKRYFTSEYCSFSSLKALLEAELTISDLDPECDGLIKYVLPESDEELQQLEEYMAGSLWHDRIVVAIPRQVLELHETALELWTLLQMTQDTALLESDPLIPEEINQLIDDARGHLSRETANINVPSSSGPRWFCKDKEYIAHCKSSLRCALSDIAKAAYDCTPKINNEMIVRKKPTAILVNARKKLNFRIIEASGQENFGLEGNTPNVSIFRTVLLRTGLYRLNGKDTWRFAKPQEIDDPGLRETWRLFEQLFAEPSEKSKSLKKFISTIKAPPYGVRAGVIPVLFAAALKAFPASISITCEGEYVSDIMPSDIEEMCRKPERYSISVLEVSKKEESYLRFVYQQFSDEESEATTSGDLIRACYEAIEQWKEKLPGGSRSSKNLSKPTLQFRNALFSFGDPVDLLLKRIPDSLDAPIDKLVALKKKMTASIDELLGVSAVYYEMAASSIVKAISFGKAEPNDIRAACLKWAECFPEEFVSKLTDQVAKGLLTRMKTDYDSNDLLINSISSILVGKSVNGWDDNSAILFDRELRNVSRRVEGIALKEGKLQGNNGAAISGMKTLIEGRVYELLDDLRGIVGDQEAKEVFRSILLG